MLPIAQHEAQVHHATVVLLRVIPPLRSSFMVAPKMMEQLTEQATEHARVYLAGIAGRFGSEHPVETEVLYGAPAERILDYAQETACDLIIIGSHGENDALRWRFGSVVQKVVMTPTPMPVLVVST